MEQLRIPGPTPLPPEVMQAISRQMINHRGPEFHKIFQDITEKIKVFFQTKNDLLILTCAGTGGLEAAIVNFFSPGDKILGVSIGVFGDRFISIAKTYGANVIPLKFEMGQAANPEAVKKVLQDNPDVKGVIITHNETSTSVTNDLKTIAPIVKDAGKLLVVDGVSSIGSIDLPVDELKIDVAISGSQKGWMVPPGMVMLSVSQEAWQAYANAKMPRFYLDLGKAKDKLAKWENPWTPAVSIIFGFQVALDMMLKEGIQNIFARHALIAKTAREGLKELGLTLLVKDEKIASNTVTGVMGTNGLDTKKLTQIMRDQYKIVLAGGQGALEGKIFRIGHLGYVSVEDITDVIANLKLALPQAGFTR
ncbi:MAG: alanine--glyoxylate aminotransferase family protein [Dehalococcoidales bacterium]|nr:alanine--glyoxylate aminotransferase family protein [Dehalococcoidales bacterium]